MLPVDDASAAGAAAPSPASSAVQIVGGPLCRLAPIITPPISSAKSAGRRGKAEAAAVGLVLSPPQRFVLLPRRDGVGVLSAANGAFVCELTLAMSTMDEDRGEGGGKGGEIESLGVVQVEASAGGEDAEYDGDDLSVSSDSNTDSDESEEEAEDLRDYIVLAGLSDGSVVEWPLRSVLSSDGGFSGVGFGMSSGGRRCIPCRRHVSGILSGRRGVLHIAGSPVAIGACYALVEGGEEKGKGATSLVRIEGIGGCGGEDGATIVTKLADLDGKKTRRHPGQRPFQMMVSHRGQHEVAIVAADPHGLTVFVDDGGNCSAEDVRSAGRYCAGCSAARSGIELTSCAVPSYVNAESAGDQIALGYSDGVLEVHLNFFAAAASGASLKNPSERGVVVRRVHWHAHALSALCYQPSHSPVSPAEMLLSGGEESVLLTWDLARGADRPLHKLPRVGRGAIVHLAAVAGPEGEGGTDILIHCSDDTLQLIRGHDHNVRWRVQGLASLPAEPSPDAVTPAPAAPILVVCPRTNLPILTALPGSPGWAHWYDPHSGRVAGVVCISPYNRISRRDAGDEAVPAPAVVHLSLSLDGSELITVDEVVSECGVGGVGLLTPVSRIVTTVKFWSWSPSMAGAATVRWGREMDVPYEMVSAMPSPHGKRGRVCALAASDDGTRAATMSPSEGGGGCFRLWGRRNTAVTGSATGWEDSAHPAPAWRCLFKVDAPSGLSNALSAHGGCLAFSPDGSVLAVSFGSHLTLWDHASAAMLSTVDCSGGGPMRGIDFLRDGTDGVLTWGEDGIAMRSPFGGCEHSSDDKGSSWSYTPGGKFGTGSMTENTIKVVAATAMPNGREVAVAIQGKLSASSTTVVLIDAITGLPVAAPETSSASRWTVPGSVVALHHADSAGSALLVLTDQGNMARLSRGPSLSAAEASRPRTKLKSRTSVSENSMLSAPKLHTYVAGSKRRRTAADDTAEMGFLGPRRRVYGNIFSRGSGGKKKSGGSKPLPSSELPTLGGAMVRAVLGRGLLRRRKINDERQ